MAKLYGEIAAKALLTLDKSFARANGQPLDASEVYYSLQAAKDYAATAQAYIGQKIVVIENGVVTHYSVEDTAGTLKELGSKPVADGTTVAIGADGKITLANIAEDNKTGTYNAVLVNGVLTWVKPSETTVEGLSDLIQALTGRVDTAEADIDALQLAVGVAAKDAVGEEGEDGYEPAVAATGLHKAIADEKARAEAAEKALDDAIKAIDFVSDSELTTALEPYAKSADVVDKQTYATDKQNLEDSIASKVDAETYATDKKAFEDEDKAIREIAEGARNTINAFLESKEIDDTVNTLKELQAEIDKMTDATELATALATKADLSYVNEELGKKQDVIPENTYDAYGSAESAKEAAIADAEGKIATAKQEAIDAAATAAAGIYATQTRVNELEGALDERLDALEAIDHTAYTTNTVFNEYKASVENTYATKDALAPVRQTADNAAAKVETLEDKIEEITSVGGEPNVIDYIKVNGTILEVEKDAEGKSTKTVNISVPTKFSNITDDSGFNERIIAAQNAADAAQGTANSAVEAANKAQGEVDALETVVGGLQTTVSGHTTTIGDHGTRIGALEQADIAHTTEYNTLNGIVSGHTAEITKKANQTALDEVSAKVSANETAITTINETTIPGINTEIAKKANAADVYTKTEVNAITGTPAEGKTLVDMIADAKSEASYDDTEVRGLITAETNRATAAEAANKALIDANAEAIADETARAEGIEGDHETRIARMETFWSAADDPEGTIDKLAEIVNYIESDKTGALDMAADIAKNDAAIKAIYTAAEGENPASGVLVTEITRVEGKADDNATAIAAINNAETGILAVAKKYTDDQLAGLPVATAEALGLVKYDDSTIKMNESNQLYVAQVSTDVLVQGTQELILFGGTAEA